MDEIELLSAAFAQLGASSEQARIMAAQILKRADQLAVEKKITREEGVAYLLNLIKTGYSGTVDPAFAARTWLPPGPAS